MSGSWSDKLVAQAKVEDSSVVDYFHLGSAVAFLKAEYSDPVEASALDHILVRSAKMPMTFGQLKTANADLAEAYMAELWR